MNTLTLLRAFALYASFYALNLNFVIGAEEITITTAEEFVNFSKSVGSKANYYEGTTIFLGSDITFTGKLSQEFKPTYGFRGTFDGQGHIIDNLILNATTQNAAPFGYSQGETIKNIVMGSSCSITWSLPCSYAIF